MKNILLLFFIFALLVFIPIAFFGVQHQNTTVTKANQSTSTAIATSGPRNVAPGRIIVKIKSNNLVAAKASVLSTPSNTITQKLNQLGIKTIIPVFASLNKGKRPNAAVLTKTDGVYKLLFNSNQSTLQILRRIAQIDGIEYAEPDYIYKTNTIPNDPCYLDSYPNNTNINCRDINWPVQYDYQWGLKKINVEPVWDITKGNPQIIIAVIDSGVDYTHPDLQNVVIKGFNYINQTNDPMDDMGHGTHVAGIINANSNNSIGIAGVSWNTKILAIKAMNSAGSGYSSDLADAIVSAANQGAKVINASWGGLGVSQTIQNAIDTVTQQGVIIVVAAGNDSADARSYFPASSRNVLTIGSSDRFDNRSNFSNHTDIDILAPGGDSQIPGTNDYANILSLKATGIDMYNDGGKHVVSQYYLRAAGTSMATPFVSGAVALLLSNNPQLLLNEVRSILRESAYKTSTDIWTSDRGYGRLDVGKAFSKLNTTDTVRIIQPTQQVPLTNSINFQFIAYGETVKTWYFEYGIGIQPISWTQLATGKTSLVSSPFTYTFDPKDLSFSDVTFRVRAVDTSNTITGEDRFILQRSYPQKWSASSGDWFVSSSPAITDLFDTGKKQIVVTTINNQTGNKIHIYNGDGTEQRSIAIPGGLVFSGHSVTIGKLDSAQGNVILMTTITPDGTKRQLHVYRPDGTEIVNGHWPFEYPNVTMTYDPENPTKIIDVDGDGKKEVLFAYNGYVYLLKSDGTLYNNSWPKYLDGDTAQIVYAAQFFDPHSTTLQIFVMSNSYIGRFYDLQGNLLRELITYTAKVTTFPSIAVADFDNDGKSEILVREFTDSVNNIVRLALYKSDNTLLWKRDLTRMGSFVSDLPKIVIADLLRNGTNDIIYATGDRIWYIDANGKDIPEWPHTMFPEVSFYTVADANGDGKPEVYAMTSYPKNIITISGGQIILNMPTNDSIPFSSPALGDIDSDNHLELVTDSSFGSPLRVYDLGIKSTAINNSFVLPWAQYQYDATRIDMPGLCFKLFCDVNNDGKTDYNDGKQVLSCLNKSGNLTGDCKKVDVRCDDKIGITDIQTFAYQCPSIFYTPTPIPTLISIPTPTITPLPIITKMPLPSGVPKIKFTPFPLPSNSE